jgi:glucose-1-phosphate thymidylyltransferase
MKGLILAGGVGTRLRPLTHTGPKQLIPLANKPNILYCLEDLVNAGITEIGVILGENMPEKVRELLGDGTMHGARITYIVQGVPRGIAHAVGCAESFMGDEPFVVYLGDNILLGGIKGMMEQFTHGADAVIALCAVPHPEWFGVAVLNENGELVKTVEKPKQPPTNLAVVGIYLFTKPIFDVIQELKPSWRNELEITDAINGLIERGHMVKTHVVTGWWKDTGTPEDILEANHMLLDHMKHSNEGTIEPGAQISGRVSIGKGTIVKESSRVRGPTIIGRDCIIGPNAYIGPNTAIGDRCKIENVEIEASIVIEGSELRCDGNIVDSLIGANSKLLSGTKMLPAGHRFVVGENTVIYL